MSNPYTPSRRAIEERITKLRQLLPELQALEREWDDPPKNAVDSHREAKAKLVVPRRVGGPRKAVNVDGKSWTEAIREVLSDGHGRTVGDIVAELSRRGRSFGPGTRPDALIRSTLNRTARRQGWAGAGNPKKWRLPTARQGAQG